MERLSNQLIKMETYQCLDLVLNEYKDYFSAKDLAKAAGIPESTLSAFRRGDKNPGVKIFDRIRAGLGQISPSAYMRFMSLLAISEIDVVKMVATAPLHVQGEILSAIASNGVFRKSAKLVASKGLSSLQEQEELMLSY